MMKGLVYIIIVIIPVISGCTGKSDDVKITEIVIEDTPEQKAFAAFWKDFSTRFHSLDTAVVRRVALDSVWLFGEMVSADMFMKRYINEYPNSETAHLILKEHFAYHGTIGCKQDPPVPGAIIREGTNLYTCREIDIEDTTGRDVTGLQITFLETLKGYRLSGINYYSYKLSDRNYLVDTIAIKQ